MRGEAGGGPSDATDSDVPTSSTYCGHMDVGVRELKQHLSEYLERAAAGEIIRVTDRGRPRAVLGPVPGLARLEAGIRDGSITPGSGAPIEAVVRQRAVSSVRAALDDDRG